MEDNIQTAVLKNISGGVAVLETETGQEILWPEDNLPRGVGIGERIYISLSREEDGRQNITNPKELLNRILSIK